MVIEQTPGFHITVYASPDDKALAVSSWLFGSLAQLGRLGAARSRSSSFARQRSPM